MTPTISNERQNRIAFIAWLAELEEKGITLSPKTIKQEIQNLTKKLNAVAYRYFGNAESTIDARELGECFLLIIELFGWSTTSEVEDLIKAPPKLEKTRTTKQ
jgi:hypothetical protein